MRSTIQLLKIVQDDGKTAIVRRIRVLKMVGLRVKPIDVIAVVQLRWYFGCWDLLKTSVLGDWPRYDRSHGLQDEGELAFGWALEVPAF